MTRLTKCDKNYIRYKTKTLQSTQTTLRTVIIFTSLFIVNSTCVSQTRPTSPEQAY